MTCSASVFMEDPLVAALDSLPHGPEFRFIDRLLSLEPGRRGVAEYTVRGDEPFLRGHFPDQPLFPGVLLLEAAAQLAGAVAQSDIHVARLPELKLTALRGAKTFGTAKPGDSIRIEARVIGRLGSMVQAQATARVRGKIVLETELTLSGEVG